MNHLENNQNAVLVLESGESFWGYGIGARGASVGELCFNTAMTGYQEIITDPSYAGQIITFTFPHIGNVGINDDDSEATQALDLRGLVMREVPSLSSNWRARADLNRWLEKCGIIGIAGVDTRQIVKLLRTGGFVKAALAHGAHGDELDTQALQQKAQSWEGLLNKDCAANVSTKTPHVWSGGGEWDFDKKQSAAQQEYPKEGAKKYKVLALDYGIKKNILRLFEKFDCAVQIVPADTSAEAILSLKPDGIFLSNGPGDPAATGAAYAIATIQKLIAADKPIFGICLGHQLLALALGATTQKMHQGHHGANHPVKNLLTGAVEITSMNHGWTVARDSLPAGVKETHISLFDDTNCGLALENKGIFSVQYHPEASPGPMDSQYLFKQFCDIMESR